uniref:Transposase n=1 Tax=Steinernema glaseri TaxID=37863 RepID=A0A1I8A3J5_9BILA
MKDSAAFRIRHRSINCVAPKKNGPYEWRQVKANRSGRCVRLHYDRRCHVHPLACTSCATGRFCTAENDNHLSAVAVILLAVRNDRNANKFENETLGRKVQARG